jgi:hypothetical protein
MVSNPDMSSIFATFAKRFVVVIFAATLGAVLFLYWAARREVWTAQQMMEDALLLRVGESSLNDVFAFSHKYNGEATGTWRDQPCVESDCLITVAPDKSDLWESHPKLGYLADRLSRRGWRFHVLVWVKDGRLTAVEQWFVYSTPKSSSFVITTVSRPDQTLCRNRFYRLHQAFAAYPGPKHFNLWVDPTATQEREMLRLNIDCVLRLSGCESVAHMIPQAWKRYEADRQLINAEKRTAGRTRS